MKQAASILAALAFLCGGAQQCWAGGNVIFDDYGPAFTYDTGSGPTVGGSSSPVGSFIAAGEFTPTASGTVGSVAFGVSLVSGTNAVTMAIAEDNGGTPEPFLRATRLRACQQQPECDPLSQSQLSHSAISGSRSVALSTHFLGVFSGITLTTPCGVLESLCLGL